METVIIEAVHITKAALRISSVCDEEGDPACFRVYKGEKTDGDTYRFELAGEHTTLSAAVWQFTEELRKILLFKGVY